MHSADHVQSVYILDISTPKRHFIEPFWFEPIDFYNHNKAVSTDIENLALLQLQPSTSTHSVVTILNKVSIYMRIR